MSSIAGRARLRRRLVRAGIGLLALAALGWALRQAPLAEMLAVLQQLSRVEIGILLAANFLVLTVLSGRWWSLLRGMGRTTPLTRVIRFRLAGFAISYFTPGPQFGGEPLQVLLLRDRENIPASIGSASVALDKAIELLGNFAFLAFGVVVLLRLRLLSGTSGIGVLVGASLLMLLPLSLLGAWRLGKRPITRALRLTDRSSGRLVPAVERLVAMSERVESEMVMLVARAPGSIGAAFAFTALSWMAMFGEYSLMAHFLGLSLTPAETIAALTAARLAFLTPLPAGLGALEAGQVAALSVLGHTPAAGLSLGLLIRGRDLLFGVAGLLVGGFPSDRKKGMEKLMREAGLSASDTDRSI